MVGNLCCLDTSYSHMHCFLPIRFVAIASVAISASLAAQSTHQPQTTISPQAAPTLPATTAADTNFDPYTAYVYRVRATNSSGQSGPTVEVTVAKNGTLVSGRSIMGLMMLAAGPGTEIEVQATGPDAARAVEALARFITGGCDER